VGYIVHYSLCIVWSCFFAFGRLTPRPTWTRATLRVNSSDRQRAPVGVNVSREKAMGTIDSKLEVLSVALMLWPALVSSVALLWKSRFIGRKVGFLFTTTLVGYGLMFGVPKLTATLVLYFVGMDRAMKAIEPIAGYWFLFLAVIGVILLITPLVSTYWLYKRRYSTVED
jgi:hypothetical protein